MNDDDNQSGRPPGAVSRDKRQDRLKLALRENLKRRKSQARDRADFTAASPDADEMPHDGREQIPGK